MDLDAQGAQHGGGGLGVEGSQHDDIGMPGHDVLGARLIDRNARGFLRHRGDQRIGGEGTDRNHIAPVSQLQDQAVGAEIGRDDPPGRRIVGLGGAGAGAEDDDDENRRRPFPQPPPSRPPGGHQKLTPKRPITDRPGIG